MSQGLYVDVSRKTVSMAVRGGKKTIISRLANKGFLQDRCKWVIINMINDIGYHNYEL